MKSKCPTFKLFSGIIQLLSAQNAMKT